MHADIMFKLNVESSLLVNGILVVVIACGSLRISFCSHSSGEVASWM